MSALFDSSDARGALHGLILVALVAIVLRTLTSAADLWSLISRQPGPVRGDCVYQVFEGDSCIGTVFFEAPARLSAILDVLGITPPQGLSDEDEKLPCNCAVKLQRKPGSLILRKMSGESLLCAGRLIDINVADQRDLAAVPGIGIRLAQAIVRHREWYGAFGSVIDLTGIPGIGRKKLAEIAPFLKADPLTVPARASARPVRNGSP